MCVPFYHSHPPSSPGHLLTTSRLPRSGVCRSELSALFLVLASRRACRENSRCPSPAPPRWSVSAAWDEKLVQPKDRCSDDRSTPLAPGKIYNCVGGLPADAAGWEKSLSPQLCAIGAAPSKTAAPTLRSPKFSRAACPHPTLPRFCLSRTDQPRLSLIFSLS